MTRLGTINATCDPDITLLVGEDTVDDGNGRINEPWRVFLVCAASHHDIEPVFAVKIHRAV